MAGKSRGRQKIKMARMSKESNLLVTFSKRRSGLFKKANELCTLCGAELAIIVFSPGKKVFCFGHPCIFTVINRYIDNFNTGGNGTTGGGSGTSSTTSQQLVEAHRKATVNELNMQLMEMEEQLEMEKKRGEELSKMRKASQKRCWWEMPANELSLQELEQLKEAMKELSKTVANQIEKIMVAAAAAGSFVGGSNSSISRGGGGGHGGHVGVGLSSSSSSVDGKVPIGLGLSMTPHEYSFGFDRSFF